MHIEAEDSKFIKEMLSLRLKAPHRTGAFRKTYKQDKTTISKKRCGIKNVIVRMVFKQN